MRVTCRQTSLSLVALYFACLLVNPASAFYNPSSGRWLSRDPINEPGLKLLTGSSSGFNLSEEKNLHAFVGNAPPASVDHLGWFGTGSDGQSCRINPLTSGRISFEGFTAAYLEENFRLITEDGSNGGAPDSSGTYSDSMDGFWWKGSKSHWYKLPDYCTALVTPALSESGFTVKWCCDSCSLVTCQLSTILKERPCRPGGIRYDEARAGYPYPWQE